MSQQKLRELVLYVAQSCEDDPDFGMIKLNKVLFNADFTWYQRTGRSITGEEYQKEKQGPVVRRMVPALREAESHGDLKIVSRPRGRFAQKRVRPLREPDLSRFSPEEIAMVDESLNALKGMTAKALSDYFHQFLGWQAAKKGEVIPYQTVYFYKRRPTKEEAEYALTLEKAV